MTKTISLKRQANKIDRRVVVDMINELADQISLHKELIARWEREKLVLENALEGGVWGKY